MTSVVSFSVVSRTKNLKVTNQSVRTQQTKRCTLHYICVTDAKINCIDGRQFSIDLHQYTVRTIHTVHVRTI